MELPPLWEHRLRQLVLDKDSRKIDRRWTVFIALSIVAAAALVAYPTDSFRAYHISLRFFFAIITLSILWSAISPLIEELPFARRNSITDLAQLSGVSPGQLWLSKAIAVHVSAFSLFFLAWPVAILCAVWGMVPPSDMLWMIFLSLLLVIFVSSATLAASARTDEDGLAYAAFFVLLAFSGFLLPFAMNSVFGGALDWMLLSPFYGYYRGIHITPLDPAGRHLMLAGMIGWSILFLILSHIQFHQKAGTKHLPKRLRTFSTWVLGLSKPAEGDHPFSQLVRREWKTALVAGTSIAIWVSGLVFLLQNFGLHWFKPVDFIFAALIVILLLNFFIKTSTGRITGEVRRENILELVITAGLKPADILQGLHHGLHELYRRHYYFCVLAFLTMMLAGLALKNFNHLELVSYLIVWAWLFYLLFRKCTKLPLKTVWRSVNLGHPAYSLAKTWTRHISGVVWLGYLTFGEGFLAYPHLSRLPYGHPLELIFIITVSLVLALVIYYDTDDYDQIIIEHLPAIAAAPVPDPSDERIATWDEVEPFHVQDPEDE